MQESFTYQHSEGERYVHSYKKVTQHTQHTHKPRIAHKTKPSAQYRRYTSIYRSVYIVGAKRFVYNSCLFLACNLTVGGNVKVFKL